LPTDDSAALAHRLATLAAEVARSDVPRAVSGELVAEPQDHSRATTAPPLGRADARIDWNADAVAIVNRVRGLSPRPGAFTVRKGRTLKLLEATVAAAPSEGTAPGTVVRADRGALWIATGNGTLAVLRAQVEGKRVSSFTDLINGRAVTLGDVLGE
jgi:methionyl-tRNA formyltransferase